MVNQQSINQSTNQLTINQSLMSLTKIINVIHFFFFWCVQYLHSFSMLKCLRNRKAKVSRIAYQTLFLLLIATPHDFWEVHQGPSHVVTLAFFMQVLVLYL